MDPKDQQTLLLAIYKENADQARHHEVQRERTTAVVAQTAGVVVGLLGFVASWNTPSRIHFAIPVFLAALGLWGFFASGKHYERARLHVQRLRECRRELSRLSQVDVSTINDRAEQAHKEDMSSSFFYGLRTHLIWKAFPLLIVAIAVALFVYLLFSVK